MLLKLYELMCQARAGPIWLSCLLANKGGKKTIHQAQ